MKEIKFILGFFLLGGAMYAQETAPNYLLYRYNMNILNPAYAGVSEDSEIGLGFRKQASDFDDSATTQYASFSILNKDLSLHPFVVCKRHQLQHWSPW